MEDNSLQKNTFIKNADNIVKALKSAHGSLTSWELKLKLHLSGSALYMALGRLEAQDKITLYPDDVNFKVVLNPESEQTK